MIGESVVFRYCRFPLLAQSLIGDCAVEELSAISGCIDFRCGRWHQRVTRGFDIGGRLYGTSW